MYQEGADDLPSDEMELDENGEIGSDEESISQDDMERQYYGDERDEDDAEEHVRTLGVPQDLPPKVDLTYVAHVITYGLVKPDTFVRTVDWCEHSCWENLDSDFWTKKMGFFKVQTVYTLARTWLYPNLETEVQNKMSIIGVNPDDYELHLGTDGSVVDDNAYPHQVLAAVQARASEWAEELYREDRSHSRSRKGGEMSCTYPFRFVLTRRGVTLPQTMPTAMVQLVDGVEEESPKTPRFLGDHNIWTLTAEKMEEILGSSGFNWPHYRDKPRFGGDTAYPFHKADITLPFYGLGPHEVIKIED
jgi:hypothetical protein